MIVLDTDVLTPILLAPQSQAASRMQAAPEEPVISIVSRIEVLRGRFDAFLKAADSEQMLKAHDRLTVTERQLAKYAVVAFNDAAAGLFDRFRHDKKTKKMGRNDLLIACIALANRATLVTRNVRDFQNVPGLKLENWAD